MSIMLISHFTKSGFPGGGGVYGLNFAPLPFAKLAYFFKTSEKPTFSYIINNIFLYNLKFFLWSLRSAAVT